MKAKMTNILGGILGLIALSSAPSLAAPQTELVEDFNATLLSLLQEERPFQARYDLVQPALQKTFDLDFMAQKVLGRGWKSLTPEQQAAWLEAFTRMTVSNYAGRFVGEPGPSFETLGQEEGSHDTVVVRTKLLDPKGENVALDYRLRETPDGWRVIDCYMNASLAPAVNGFRTQTDEHGEGRDESNLSH